MSVTVESSEEDLQLATATSYELAVGADGTAKIHAPTVFGALYALETLSQLITYEPDGDYYKLSRCPVLVRDGPRFKFRGLMVDIARHFVARPMLERVVDAMSAAKLNVLHLHISDEESFPMQSSRFGELWQTAFSSTERYATREMKALVSYAKDRGVAVLPEFDSPGHSKAMCAGGPTGICMKNCSVNSNWPLRPLEHTFEFLAELWGGVADVFPFAYRHIGGDEVKSQCWDEDETSKTWMRKAGLNSSETYVHFVNRNVNISLEQGKLAIAWDDAWKDYGTAMHPRTTWMFWTSNAVNGERAMQKAADDGHDVIAASGDPWYLSNSNEYTVRDMYEYDPCDCSNNQNSVNCVNTTAACARVLGVEAAFWMDSFDSSQLENGLWPRAAAVAERGWSSSKLKWYTNTTQATQSTATRLGMFRCHLMERGVAAMPVTVEWNHKYGSNRVSEPGSCMVQ